MQTAIQDNIEIEIHDYNPDGGALICADPECSARLKYVPASRQNASSKRSAYFASIDREEHSIRCEKLTSESSDYESSLSLKQAILQGKHVVLSLNDLFGIPPQLWVDFEAAKYDKKPDTKLQAFKDSLRDPITGEKGHSSHSIKSVKELISHIQRIYAYGHDAALLKTHITWQDKTISFSDFYLDTADQQKMFFRQLYKKSKCGDDFKCAVHNDDQTAWDMPRLFRFKPRNVTKKDPMVGQLRSSGILIQAAHSKTGRPLLLQHHVSMAFAKNALNRQYFGGDIFILATPNVNYTQSSKAVRTYNSGSRKAEWVTMLWSVDGNHQFIPAKGIKIPKPKSGDQPPLI